ncbi:MAG: EamA family transporter [Roseiflexaceae bacterium]|nr:EamA family transporter [Roseiflexaceae bacterium]
MHNRARTGYTLTLLSALSWSLTGPGIAYLLTTYRLPGLALAFWRDAFIALACVGVFALVRPDVLRISWRELRSFALIGAISIGIYHALWVFSIGLNGAAVAIVLIYTFPSFVTLGSWLLFGERPTRAQIGALVVSLAGCVLLARAYDLAVLQVSWLGLLVGLSTGLTHAGYVLFSQRSVQTRSPWTSLTYTMLFGALTLLAMSLLFQPAAIVAAGSDPAPWLLLLALALGPTLGGYALFTNALRFIPGPLASLVVVAEAPAGAMLAFLLLGERLEPAQLAGIVLIIGALVVPQLARPAALATPVQSV